MLRILVVLVGLMVGGCAVTPPQSLHFGDEVEAPKGCQDYRLRGGFCSLQDALDSIHALHEYISDPWQYGHYNHWALSPVGDCADFALSVRAELNARGIHGTHLLRGYLPERGIQKGHLVVYIDGWVLDNQHRRPIRIQEWPYTPYVAGDESGVWRSVTLPHEL